MYICYIHQFWLAPAQAWSISAIRLSFHARQALLPVLTPLFQPIELVGIPVKWNMITMTQYITTIFTTSLLKKKTVSDPYYVYSLCKYFGP